MEKEDHLDKETSVSLALKESGLELKTKTRTIAIIDRISGNFLEWIGFKSERRSQINRQKIELETALIKMASQSLLKRAETDEAFALGVLETAFKRDARRQLHKDGVIAAALEQLKLEPPSERENFSGPDKLGDEFMDRFERYAEDASTDELQERWGRVLASEIKNPGSFTAKVMRVVDELNAETAREFESFCENRLEKVIPKCLSGELPFYSAARLETNGLILPSTAGHIRKFRKIKGDDGAEMRFCQFGDYAIGVNPNADLTTLPISENSSMITSDQDGAVPVYILTDVGFAISTILPDKQNTNLGRLYWEIEKLLPGSVVAMEGKDGSFNVVSIAPLAT